MYFCALLAVMFYLAVSSRAAVLASGETAVLDHMEHLAVVSCAV